MCEIFIIAGIRQDIRQRADMGHPWTCRKGENRVDIRRTEFGGYEIKYIERGRVIGISSSDLDEVIRAFCRWVVRGCRA